MVPRAALAGHPELGTAAEVGPTPPPSRPFVDPDPFRELVYPSAIEAKRAIADLLGVPLGRLAAEERAAIDAILTRPSRETSCWRASGPASQYHDREMAGASTAATSWTVSSSVSPGPPSTPDRTRTGSSLRMRKKDNQVPLCTLQRRLTVAANRRHLSGLQGQERGADDGQPLR